MIRLASKKDLTAVLKIYEHARIFMLQNNNPNQWGNKYPSKYMIEEDIKKKQLYVIDINDEIYGVFAFIIGEDETYKIIDEGKWLSNTIYGTIHRVASNGKIKGIFEQIIDYCKKQISHLRIDTHPDNKIMQYLIIKNGFIRCGMIRVEDGTKRIAYEKL